MRSVAWTGDRVPTQDWGWTTETAEPWYSTPTFSGHFHCGIDIPMDTGEPIFAARAGTVAYVGVGFLAVHVGSGTDWYLHGSKYVVGPGQALARGQLIGYAGNVAPPGGSSSGSHLHFEAQSTLSTFCNTPATSRDPDPVLTVLLGADSGILGGFMWQDVDIEAVKYRIAYSTGVLKWADMTLQQQGMCTGIITLPELKAKLDAITFPVPVDNAAVLTAIADLKAHPAIASDPVLVAAVQKIDAHFSGH